MRKRAVTLASLSGVAAGAVGLALHLTKVVRAAEAPPDTPSTRPSENAVPVIVELFTSEGCSSCPPADDVLAALERSQPVPGAMVVPLAFHVDYWDDLGWPDPFASASFTSRQRAYAVNGRMYTPQAVVDGWTELVGSNGGGLKQAIEQAAFRTHAPVQIALRPNGASIDASVHVGQLPRSASGAPASDAVVVVALTRARATIAVARGENAGRSLRHTAIVLQLERAGSVDAGGGDARTNLRIPSGVSRGELRVVAFVQRAADHEIVGSATRTLTTGPQPLQPP